MFESGSNEQAQWRLQSPQPPERAVVVYVYRRQYTMLDSDEMRGMGLKLALTKACGLKFQRSLGRTRTLLLRDGAFHD